MLCFEIRLKLILMVSFTLCKKQDFLFISLLVSGNSSIILLSFSLVSVLFQRNLGPLNHDFCWSLWFFNKSSEDATPLLHISARFLSLGTWHHCATELPSNIYVTLFAKYVLKHWESFLMYWSIKVESFQNVVLYIGRSNSLITDLYGLMPRTAAFSSTLGREKVLIGASLSFAMKEEQYGLSFMNSNLRYAIPLYAFSEASQKHVVQYLELYNLLAELKQFQLCLCFSVLLGIFSTSFLHCCL